MFWADKIVSTLKDLQLHHVDDMKTPSGRIHVGALRGVIIHDLIFKAFKDAGKEAVYTYVFNDHDPMDDLPVYLDQEKFSQYLGQPFYKVPSPEPGFENYGQFWAQEYIEVFNKLGAKPEIVWSSQLYREGKMNTVIVEALDNADKVLKIYQEVAGYPEKRKGWLPFQAICPNCGKVGTTETYDWDGETVAYECKPDLVKWATGCGHSGRVSPLNGNGKLLWKVDWPAHWKVLGVTFEGAGKDHFSKGGSWDMSGRLCREIFDYPAPEGIGYEFFLIGGKKMSSSKGLGSSVTEVSEILPPELLRFLMVRTPYKRAINFDPSGMTIPDLFDEYDRCAKEWFNKGRESDLGRVFELSQVGEAPKNEIKYPRFRDIATYLQMPGVNLEEQFPDGDKKILEERAYYAKIWLERYAPVETIIKVSEQLPEEAKSLTDKQKNFLKEIDRILQSNPETEKDFELAIYQTAKDLELPSKEAFMAIYTSFLGKMNGPKAAPFLLSLDKEFVNRRIEEVLNL